MMISDRDYCSRKEDAMLLKPKLTPRYPNLRIMTICLAAIIILTLSGAENLSAAAPAKQKTFPSAEAAVVGLVEALKAGDTKELTTILGPEAKDIIFSGDPVRDKAGWEDFLRLYAEKNLLEESGPVKAILHIGNDEWPFPVPIVKTGKVWRFDSKEGKREILARRIGKNELSAVQVLLAFVDAQREYALKDRDGNGLLEYATKFASDPGKKNGLYWDAKDGEERSPLGPLAASAQRQGYRQRKLQDKPVPYHGYFFRIITSQGKDAPGGAYDYMANGHLIGGFAFVAYPATYGNSGIMTFIVNHDGVVYQKNLGKKTAGMAQAMERFNPDKTWKMVDVKP
jgi:hypothetical protein